ncbi:MAG: hypothetical protein ACTSWY_07010 [Promethearchaeota archaeon]
MYIYDGHGHIISTRAKYTSPKRNMNDSGYSWEDINKKTSIRRIHNIGTSRSGISRKNSPRNKRRGSQGVTTAIILIAFIISAAGIAFVILTMGSNMAQKTESIGSQASEYTSALLEVVGGGLIMGVDTDNDGALEGLYFSIRLVLQNGKISFSSDAMEISVVIGSNNEARLTYNNTLNSVDDLTANPNNQYGIIYYDGDSDDILENNEMAQFFLKLGSDIASNKKFSVFIMTSGATVKIEKYAPGSISSGSNIIT